jgi:hypothetical protein
MQNKRPFNIVFTSVVIILIQLIALPFTDEVSWTLSDFMVEGTLLMTIGLLCELVLRKIDKLKYRVYRWNATICCHHHLGRTCRRHFKDTVQRTLA